MTDEMTVQAQRPSAMPYVLGGAGVGAVAGGSLAKWGNIGIQGQAYSSFDDLVKEANNDDAFIKKMAEKEGETGENWSKLKKAAEEMAAETKKFEEAVPEQIRNEQTFTDYMEKLAAQEKAATEYDNKLNSIADDFINEFKSKPENNTWEIDGKKYVKDADGKFMCGDKELTNEMWRNDLKKTDEKNVLKHNNIAEKTKDLTETKAKNEADEAFTKAEKALSDKADELKITKEFDKWKTAKKSLTEAGEKAKKDVTDDLLSKCKKPKVWLTALAGAAALALVGAMIRPKGDQA